MLQVHLFSTTKMTTNLFFTTSHNSNSLLHQHQHSKSVIHSLVWKPELLKMKTLLFPGIVYARWLPAWNQDQDLKSAFKNSTVWYYQELARRVGGERMKYWLDKANYGNADTSGGIDKYWLTGGLRITPEQQIDFLRRLHDNKLPFSQRSMDIVKDIMIAKDTLDYVVRAKTGWGEQDDTNIGWYVGYVETTDNVYYFANCIQTADSEKKDFVRARTEIVYQILNELKLIKK